MSGMNLKYSVCYHVVGEDDRGRDDEDLREDFRRVSDARDFARLASQEHGWATVHRLDEDELGQATVEEKALETWSNGRRL